MTYLTLILALFALFGYLCLPDKIKHLISGLWWISVAVAILVLKPHMIMAYMVCFGISALHLWMLR